MVLIKDTMLLYHSNTETLTTNKEIAHGDAQLQVLTPSGASRTVTLPAVGESYGSMFYIVNANTGSYYLSIQDQDATEILKIHAEGVGMVMCDGSTWNEIFSKTKKGSGTSTFAGNGTARSIAHGLGTTPTVVTVTPTADTDGYLGTVWVTKDATYIYVYNSGSATTSFSWLAQV